MSSQMGRVSFFFLTKPVAFCTILTDGLALSGVEQKVSKEKTIPLEA
jgi:hypothetical protein